MKISRSDSQLRFFFCNAQSLSGHSSPVESVNFDPSEVIVAGGAASGTIKLWDLEEAKGINWLLYRFHP